MFETEESVPWHQRITSLILAAFLLPPLGLVLLWTRRQTPNAIKLAASLAIILLGAGYFVLYRTWSRSGNEAHYAELEQHRAQQQLEAAQQPLVSNPATATGAPVAQPGQPGAAPATTESASAHVTRNYWTNFRGPNRDGRYDEMAVLTNWPAQGLPLVWKQPVGLGYASFTIADGRAYTIEQRRRQEVVAAYDVNTGRELWAQGWNAEYNDSTGDGPRTTPTWDDGRLYALGATGELRCLDAKTGAVSWAKNILSDNQADNLSWAMAASPLIVDDKVIVLPGGT